MTEIQIAPPATRTLYERCPLCESRDFAAAGEIDCRAHPLYQPGLGDTIRWMTCRNCEHVFVEGPFTPEAQARLLSQANPSQLPGAATVARRPEAAKIVTTVSTIRGSLEGRWLDVGCGNGALLTTAQEFGYSVEGLDLRQGSVQRLAKFGYRAHCADFLGFGTPASYDVISLADALEHMSEPRAAVAHARELLTPGGLLFVSLPNRESFAWRWLDDQGQNPYWTEIEHYHNFTRSGLYALLLTENLRPCHYAVSERYRACMEVCAARD